MPVYPLNPQPPAKLGAYPHMARRDAPLWERFLDAYGAEFTGVSYDVALGGTIPTGADLDPDTILGWRYATAVKIDAVAFRPDEVWIIEVKPNASLSAIGQALGYVVLAERETLTDLPLVPVIVTDNATTDLRYVCAALGVDLIVLVEPLPPTPA